MRCGGRRRGASCEVSRGDGVGGLLSIIGAIIHRKQLCIVLRRPGWDLSRPLMYCADVRRWNRQIKF